MHRRDLLRLAPALLAAPAGAVAAAPLPLRRAGPLGEVPALGMGTWLTFDVGDDPGELARRREVLRRFFAAGGALVDSSPMYGRAEAVLGELLPQVPGAANVLAATKVWTPFDRLGPGQLAHSLGLWRVPRFDVVLVHNVLNWRGHLPLLRRWKEEGRARAIGISTSHGSRHDEVERILRSEPLDVLQITYNLADTRAEALMERAAARGMAVVVNRPFDGGGLFDAVGGRAVPPEDAERGCTHWSQVFLAWVLSHPAVTCAIPATRQPAHMDENMATLRLPLPDAAARRRLQRLVGAA